MSKVNSSRADLRLSAEFSDSLQSFVFEANHLVFLRGLLSVLGSWSNLEIAMEDHPAAKRARVADGEASGLGDPPGKMAPALHLALLDSCFVEQHDQVQPLNLSSQGPPEPLNEPLAITAALDRN